MNSDVEIIKQHRSKRLIPIIPAVPVVPAFITQVLGWLAIYSAVTLTVDEIDHIIQAKMLAESPKDKNPEQMMNQTRV